MDMIRITALFIVAILVCASAHAAVTYNTIALSGPTGTALGLGPNQGPGVNFSSFGEPVLNAAGEVAFVCTITGTGVDTSNDGGIWSSVGGSLAAVAREGGDGPGPNVGEGLYFSDFGSFGKPVLNAAGEIAFTGILTGTGVNSGNDRGIWSNAGGTLAAVAREGGDGPGPNLGTGIRFINLTAPVLHTTGGVAFIGELFGTGVDRTNNSGIWSDAGGALTVVARAGDVGPGPNVGEDVDFSFFKLNNPVLNAAGEVAFFGYLTGTGVDETNNRGIWSNAGGTLAAVARKGDDGPGPGLGSGVNFASLGDNPAFNAAGVVAFAGTLIGTGIDSSNNRGIWSNASGSLEVVARSGGEGPGPSMGAGISFSNLLDPVLNIDGEVTFVGFITGPGVNPDNDSGIWSNASGSLALVAREGSDASGPNVGDGVYFNGFNQPVFNTRGEVAFHGFLAGTGVDLSNNWGIWSNAGGVLRKIVRTGDLFDVDPGAGIDLRVISSLGLSFLGGSGGEDGRRLSFNDHGLLTFSLRFTDGSSGIFTACAHLLGDLNGDGFVGIADLNIVLGNWNQNVAAGDQFLGDPSGDGFVGIEDLNLVLGNWNTGTPPGSETMRTIPEPAAVTLLVGTGALTLPRRGQASSLS